MSGNVSRQVQSAGM